MLTTSFFEELLFFSVAVLLDLISMVSQICTRSNFLKNSNGQAPEVNSEDELSVLHSAPQWAHNSEAPTWVLFIVRVAN